MRTVVCFGDSNTYGMPPMRFPGDRRRYAHDERWPGVMRAELGADWMVVEEGLSGRTTVHDDPIEGIYKNGFRSIHAVLETHRPIDVMIVMLGTNDLKLRFSVPAEDIARSVGVLLQAIKASQDGIDNRPPKMLVVAPPPAIETGFLASMFSGAAEKSRKFGALYADVAEQFEAAFFDAGTVIETSPLDGIHLEAAAHATLGRALAQVVRGLA